MACKQAAFLFLGALIVLAFAVSTGESRNLHRTKRVALFNPVTLCEHATQYSKLCEKIAKGSPMITSPNTLVQANVAAAIDSAHNVSGQVTSLMKSSSRDYQGIMGSALNACKDSYDSALDALQKSQTLLKGKGSHDDLMTQLSAASQYLLHILISCSLSISFDFIKLPQNSDSDTLARIHHELSLHAKYFLKIHQLINSRM
jgi:pectinesterase inhibitor-like protein